MAEVLSHPWVTSPDVASREDVINYFAQLRADVDAKAEAAL
jgi:hypothetical protein